ncbi:MAG: hypothetical protein ABF430_12585 [Acetobacter persici]|uniref:hypothetical protein n=1 Tax=Acetobacter persici TaxID=1076596 RepID=UPI0039EC0C58
MSKWKTSLSGAVVGLCCLWWPPEAEAQHSCIVASISETLLGGQSDTPLMPVKINNQPAALFLSYDYESIYVKNSVSMNFDKLVDESSWETGYVLNTFGKREKAHAIRVKTFSFGGFNVPDAKLVLLKGESKQSVQGLPVIGIIGNVFLNNFAVLFDMKSRKITFFEVKDGCENKEEITKIMGGDFHEVNVNVNANRLEVAVRISGRKMHFFINPDLDMTEMPVGWLADYHIPLVKKDEKSEVRFNLNEGYISNIATVENLTIGDDTEKNRKIKVADKIYEGSLGLDFFADKVVLVDAVNSRMYFRKSDGVSQDPGHNLHFETSKNANIDVK